MATNRTRTGIILCIAFAVGYAGYAWLNPARGPTTESGALGVGISRGNVQTTAGDNPKGFKGTDEELQAVGAGRGTAKGFKGTDEELQAVTGN